MIQVFVTGGTFDKEYNYLSGGLYFKETHIPTMLGRGRSTLDVDVRTLMMVDSLEMNDPAMKPVSKPPWACSSNGSERSSRPARRSANSMRTPPPGLITSPLTVLSGRRIRRTLLRL